MSSKTGIPVFELIQIRKGSPANGGGTWVHENIALHLAQWCSPAFAVQVTEWIKELIVTGRVEIQNHPAAADTEIAEVRRELREIREMVRASQAALPAWNPRTETVDIVERCKQLNLDLDGKARGRVRHRILPRLLMCDDQPILKGRVWHFYGSNLAELTRDLIAEDAAVAARQKASPQRSIMDLVKNRTGQPASN
jgi:hypothetical protein